MPRVRKTTFALQVLKILRLNSLLFAAFFFSAAIASPSPQTGSDLSRDNPIKVVYPVVMPPYSFEDNKGEAQGLAIDLLRLWSKKTGIPIQFKSAPWNQGLEMMKEGKADLHAALYRTPEREAYLDYAAVVAPSQGRIFYHKNVINMNGLEDLKGFRVGVVQGSYHEQYLQKNMPQVALISYHEFPDMLAAAQTGDIRVFLEDAGTTVYRLKESGLVDEFRYHSSAAVYRNNFWIAARKGDNKLAKALTDGMALITPEERAALERKWLPATLIKTPDTLFIAMSSDYAPFSFINPEGKPAGFFVDLWRLWAEKTGKKIEFLPSTWDNSLNNLKNGSADIHSGMFYSDARARWLDFSASFYETGSCFFYPSKHKERYARNDFAGEKIGVLEGSYHGEYLKGKHPNAEVISFSSREKLLRAVMTGEISACLSEYSSTMALINSLGLTGIFDAEQSRYSKQKVYAGVLKGNAQLLFIVNKGFQGITQNELATIEERWISSPRQEYYRRLGKWFLAVVGAGLAVLCLFLFWNISLSRKVKERTAILAESEERFRSTFEQAAVGIAHVSPEGKFLRINRKFCDIVGYSGEEMLELKFQDITYSDDLAVDLEQVDLLLSGKINTYSIEKRYKCKDGRLVWVNLTVALVRDEAGQPLWFVSIIEDIRDRKQVQKQLEERLNFEELLTAISTRFISLSAERIDDEIKAVQKELCECLGLDISALWQFSPDRPGDLLMTHIYVQPDFLLDVSKHMAAMESFPWSLEMVMKKEVVVLPRVTDAPAAAAVDLDGWKHFGIRSVLTFPLFVGDGPSFGALNFNILKEEGGWSDEIIKNLQIVAQIFATALNRKSIEVNLRENEARLSSLIFNIGDWVWETDENGVYTYSSPQGFELLGRVIGKTPFDFMPPDEAKRVAALFFDIASMKMPIHDLENWNINRGGKRICLLTNALPIFDAKGNFKGYRGVDKDITARKQVEEALAESEARYRMLFESTPEGILLIGPDGRVHAANIPQARIYGYESPQQLEGMYAPLFVAEQDRERAAGNMKDLLQGKELRDRSYTAVRQDGSEFAVEVTSVILRGPGQEVQGYLCLTRDVTESKRNEIERVQLRLELAHLARVMTMNELSGSLAHEINQPLGAILNNASAAKLLLSQVKDKPGDLNEIIEDIIKDTKRAGDVVRKIRGMVKKGEMEFEQVQMNELIEEVIALFRNAMSVDKVSLNLGLTPDLAKVRGDRVHLQQVLLNLITNALEAIKECPSKILTIRSSLRAPDMVIVSVSDSGPGINEAIKDIVFKPFFTTKKGGLGFGLAICRSIIEEHGGKVWTENNPDKGATIVFSLKAWKEGSA